MAVTLRIEAPVGNILTAPQLGINSPVRFTGTVTTSLGLFAGGISVVVTVSSTSGVVWSQWIARTNWRGNYWIDTETPDIPGSYLVQARAQFLIGADELSLQASFAVSLAPPTTGFDVVVDAPPSSTVGALIRISIRVTANGIPVLDQNVSLLAMRPDRSQFQGQNLFTNANGVAILDFVPDVKGVWMAHFWAFLPTGTLYLTRSITVVGVGEPLPPPGPPPAEDKLPGWVAPVGAALGTLLLISVVRGGRR